jgi:hypothetical protein
MPEFQQTPFYIDSSRRQKGPVSYIARLWCGRLRGLLPRCVMKFLRSGGRSGNWSRNCGFRLSGRNFEQRSISFAVGVGTLCNHARYYSGIGIRQNVAFSLPRLRLVLLDREHKGSENQAPQNAGCKPRSIAIETSDYVACQWTLPCVSQSFNKRMLISALK